MEVDRNSDTPPYKQIAHDLRVKILSGELAGRARLPSVSRLVQEVGVARTTARKALNELVKEGLARRVTGWGTHVVPEDERPGVTDPEAPP